VAHRDPEAATDFHHEENGGDAGAGLGPADVDPVLAAGGNGAHGVFGQVVGDLQGIRQSSAPVVPLRFVMDLRDERSGRGAEAAEPGGRSAGTNRSNPQLAHFIVVILAVQNVPLLRAFQDDLALVCNLHPR